MTDPVQIVRKSAERAKHLAHVPDHELAELLPGKVIPLGEQYTERADIIEEVFWRLKRRGATQ